LTSSLSSRQSPNPPLLPYTTLFRSPPDTPTATSCNVARPCSRCTVRPYLQQHCAGTTCTPISFSTYAFSTNRVMRWRRTKCCSRSEEHTSELQSRENLVCRLLLE